MLARSHVGTLSCWHASWHASSKKYDESNVNVNLTIYQECVHVGTLSCWHACVTLSTKLNLPEPVTMFKPPPCQKAPSKSRVISLYFVARSDAHKHAIRVMDYHTLDLIAPTTVIQNYTNGIWWTLSTERAVRLKLSNILGIRLSAIAFTSP